MCLYQARKVSDHVFVCWGYRFASFYDLGFGFRNWLCFSFYYYITELDLKCDNIPIPYPINSLCDRWLLLTRTVQWSLMGKLMWPLTEFLCQMIMDILFLRRFVLSTIDDKIFFQTFLYEYHGGCLIRCLVFASTWVHPSLWWGPCCYVSFLPMLRRKQNKKLLLGQRPTK